jgi:hypothetical protein
MAEEDTAEMRTPDAAEPAVVVPPDMPGDVYMIVRSEDTVLEVWDVCSSHRLLRVEVESWDDDIVRVSVAGNLLLRYSTTTDYLRCWDICTGQLKYESRIDYLPGNYNMDIMFNQTGTIFLMHSDNGPHGPIHRATLRHAVTGDMIWDLCQEVTRHDLMYRFVNRVGYDQLIVVQATGSIRLWDALTSNELAQFQLQRENVKIYPKVVSGMWKSVLLYADAVVRVYDYVTGTELCRLPLTRTHNVGFGHDDLTVIAIVPEADRAKVEVYDIATGWLLHVFRDTFHPVFSYVGYQLCSDSPSLYLLTSIKTAGCEVSRLNLDTGAYEWRSKIYGGWEGWDVCMKVVILM